MSVSGTCSKCGTTLLSWVMPGQCPNCLIDLAVVKEERSDFPNSVLGSERRFGDYILQQPIGSGGMGIVYQAHQVSLNRRVALKFIRGPEIASPTLLRRFTIEAEATARLHHPNIVTIYEVGEAGGQPFISMELVEGESLGSMLTKGLYRLGGGGRDTSNAGASQAQIVQFLIKVARAVHHAHERGVLHRDLKPSNILVDSEGEPHLTDFGLAKIFKFSSDDQGPTSVTATGDLAGTPAYMAPEQVTNCGASACSDVYGLGAILYEMLTGRAPFSGGTPFEVLRQVEHSVPKPPRTVNKLVNRDLETICLKCLEKHPHHRYESAAALAEDLQNWLEKKPVNARKAGAVRRAMHWTKRNPLGATFILMLLLSLLAALAVLHEVRNKNQQIDISQAVLFDGIVHKINAAWEDPAVAYITIESEYLYLLAGKPLVYSPPGAKMSFGIRIAGDPISFARERAKLLIQVEEQMSKMLGRRVSFNLMLFKRNTPGKDAVLESIREGTTAAADFMLLSPIEYLRLKSFAPGLAAVALENRELAGVLIVRNDSPIQQLRELRGKSVVFSDPDGTISFLAKAAFADAGITKSQLASTLELINEIQYTEEAPQVARSRKVANRETVLFVLDSKVEAGVTTERRYQLQQHHGLRKIADFPGIPRVFAARPGLDPALVRAFQTSITRLNAFSSAAVKETFDFDEPFAGAQAINDSNLNPFRSVIEKAARFEEVTASELLSALRE
jgi:serine/threonine protein kinase/ABC-type phosphate/phosphonate transport system substrate-binding protein